MPLSLEDLEQQRKQKEEQDRLRLEDLERRKQEAEKIIDEARVKIKALVSQKEELIRLRADLEIAYGETGTARQERKIERGELRDRYDELAKVFLEERVKRIIGQYGNFLKEGVSINTLEELKEYPDLYADVVQMIQREQGEEIQEQLKDEGIPVKEVNNSPVLEAVGDNREVKEKIKTMLGIEGVINRGELEKKIQERLEEIDRELEDLRLQTPEGKEQYGKEVNERIKKEFQERHRKELDYLARINDWHRVSLLGNENDLVSKSDIRDPNLTFKKLAQLYVAFLLEKNKDLREEEVERVLSGSIERRWLELEHELDNEGRAAEDALKTSEYLRNRAEEKLQKIPELLSRKEDALPPLARENGITENRIIYGRHGGLQYEVDRTAIFDSYFELNRKFLEQFEKIKKNEKTLNRLGEMFYGQKSAFVFVTRYGLDSTSKDFKFDSRFEDALKDLEEEINTHKEKEPRKYFNRREHAAWERDHTPLILIKEALLEILPIIPSLRGGKEQSDRYYALLGDLREINELYEADWREEKVIEIPSSGNTVEEFLTRLKIKLEELKEQKVEKEAAENATRYTQRKKRIEELKRGY